MDQYGNKKDVHPLRIPRREMNGIGQGRLVLTHVENHQDNHQVNGQNGYIVMI